MSEVPQDQVLRQIASIVDKENGESYREYFEQRYDPSDYQVIDGDNFDKIADLVDESKDLSSEELDKLARRVDIAGRITSIRTHANFAFVDVADDSSSIQIIIDKRDIEDTENQVEDLRFGHEIVLRGLLVNSRKGELSVITEEFPTITARSFINFTRTLLNEGLSEYEQRLERFARRRAMKASIRNSLESTGFAEVITPVLNAVPSGGNADAFTTFVKALEKDAYLRIAPELYLKTAIIEGYARRVYEFAVNFRNEGVDREHSPEFEMLEFYASYWTIDRLKEFTTQIITDSTQAALGQTKVDLELENGSISQIDLGVWQEVKFRDVFKDRTGLDLDILLDLDAYELKEILIEYLKNTKEQDDHSRFEELGVASLLDKIFKKTCRPHMTQPVYVVDYPAVMMPLARPKTDDPRYVDMFQGIIGSTELIKGYQELNDPVLQLSKLSEQAAAKNDVDNEMMEIDWDYIRSMLKGLPPTAGCGIGIDRLAAILSGSKNIHQVMPFSFKDRFKTKE